MSPRRLCPSADPGPSARLLAVAQPDGALAFLGAPVALDEEAISRVRSDPRAMAQVRLVAPCVEAECAQWAGGCTVAARASRVELAAPETLLRLPRCGIRSECRWHAESGRAACRVCPAVPPLVPG